MTKQTGSTASLVDLGWLGEQSVDFSYEYTPGRLSGSRDLPDDPPELRLRSLRCALLSEEGQESLRERLEEDEDFMLDLFCETADNTFAGED
jgi:hypothetical protein